jgi:hypothetical protein
MTTLLWRPLRCEAADPAGDETTLFQLTNAEGDIDAFFRDLFAAGLE